MRKVKIKTLFRRIVDQCQGFLIRKGQVSLDETSPDHICIIIPLTSWQEEESRSALGRMFLGVLALPLLILMIWDANRDIGDVFGPILVGLLLCGGPALLTIGFFIGFLGFEEVIINTLENRVTVSTYLVPKWFIFPGIRLKRTAYINDTSFGLTVPKRRWGRTIQGKDLYIFMHDKRIGIAGTRSQHVREHLSSTLRKYLAPHYDYTVIDTVIFGNGDFKGFNPWTTLYNPDVSQLTKSMSTLQQVKICTESYDFHQVERFITYAVNYIGQKYLKKAVAVELYGSLEYLHPNLRNTFSNLCKSLNVYEAHEIFRTDETTELEA